MVLFAESTCCIYVQKGLRDVQSVNVNIGFRRYYSCRRLAVVSNRKRKITWKWNAISISLQHSPYYLVILLDVDLIQIVKILQTIFQFTALTEYIFIYIYRSYVKLFRIYFLLYYWRVEKESYVILYLWNEALDWPFLKLSFECNFMFHAT